MAAPNTIAAFTVDNKTAAAIVDALVERAKKGDLDSEATIAFRDKTLIDVAALAVRVASLSMTFDDILHRLSANERYERLSSAAKITIDEKHTIKSKPSAASASAASANTAAANDKHGTKSKPAFADANVIYKTARIPFTPVWPPRVFSDYMLTAYRRFGGGQGGITADGSGTRDTAVEEYLCVVENKDGEQFTATVSFEFELQCYAHCGGIQSVKLRHSKVSLDTNTDRSFVCGIDVHEDILAALTAAILEDDLDETELLSRIDTKEKMTAGAD
jgi:hypothetical protein